jgi:hypothetical protein
MTWPQSYLGDVDASPSDTSSESAEFAAAIEDESNSEINVPAKRA